MENRKVQSKGSAQAGLPTLRDLAAIGFRHGRLILFSFFGILVGVVLGVWLYPERYEAQMKVLVKRERVDPVVSSEPGGTAKAVDVSEEELRSEVELLKGRDLLEKVALASGLYKSKKPSLWSSLFSTTALATHAAVGPAPGNANLPRVMLELEQNLRAGPLSKTNVILVTYTSPDPEQAARVLNTLAERYLEKHTAVHRPPGAFDFFQEETDRSQKELTQIQLRLEDLADRQGVVSAPLEKDLVLRQLQDFDGKLQDTRATFAEVGHRIRSLEAQLAATPGRITTEVRDSDNRELLQHLESTWLNLQLKQIEQLGKYDPSYRTVREVEKQLTQTQSVISAAQKNPLREETTDRNPLHQALQAELEKNRTEFDGLKARSAEIAKTVGAYRAKARRLEQTERVQHDLIRAAKAVEQNYLLYLHKKEEARVADALNDKQILNVSLIEAATVPAMPSGLPASAALLLGGMLATLVSLGLAFVSDYWDPSFRTPDEVRTFLGLPVLAAIPKKEGPPPLSHGSKLWFHLRDRLRWT